MHGLIKPLRAGVAVTARPRIGRLETLERQFPAGHSLAEMAADFAADMPPEFWVMGVALIDDRDDEPIEPRHWSMVRPKAGHSVAFVIMPGKSGGALQLFAQVAIIAAQAFAYSIPGIGPLVAAGIGLGGSAVLGMLAGKPTSSSQKPAKQLGQAGFANNTLEPYGQLGTVLGVRRVSPSFMAPPVFDIDDKIMYGTAILALAGRHTWRDARVNGTPPNLFAQNIREGLISDLDPALYTNVKWQESRAQTEISRQNTEMDSSSDARYFMAHDPDNDLIDLYDLPQPQFFRLPKRRFPDRVIFDFLFDQGLYRTDASGKGDVAFEISFVKEGAETVFLPHVHFQANFKQPCRAKLVIEFAADPGGITAPSSASLWRQAFYNWKSTARSSTAHSYYGAPTGAAHVGVTAPNVCTIYCPPASIPLDGSYQISLLAGCGVWGARMNYSTGVYSFNGAGAILHDFMGYHDNGAHTYCIEDQATVQSHVVVEQFSREFDTEAVVADGISTFEITTKNQNIDQISAVAERWVDKRWNGAAWVAEPHISSNPAELAYDVMTNALPSLLARPLSPALVDDASLGVWADFCTLNGLTCNAYIDSGSLEDVLPIIFEAGHAYLKRSQKWGVYIEKSRVAETPVMVFSPRNSRGFLAEKSFDHKPHALRVTFDDEDDDFQTNPELVVYAPGFDEFTATEFLSAHYAGITQEWQAMARANLDLAIIYYRDKTYSLETDARYLVAGRGSLVGVSHYVLSEAHGFAAIRDVIRQTVGGVTKITGFVLDTDLDMQPSTTGIAINTFAGTVVRARSTQVSKVRELVLAQPIADDPEIEAGCTLTSGVVSNEFLYCIVDDVKPGANGMAKLILVDEAPEIHGATREGLNDLYSSPDLYAEADLYHLNN